LQSDTQLAAGQPKVADRTARAVPPWRQRRRDRILAAAADQFAARPYSLVSMDDVAAAASMGKATLYRYFPSKEDLYVAVFDRVLDELTGKLAAAAAQGGSAIAILTRLIATLAPTLAENFRALRAADDDVIQAAERKRRLFRNRRQSITARVEEAILAGIAAGELRPVRANACAHMIVGMIWTYSANLPESPDAIAQTVADIFLNGTLAAPKG
jgi:AcrR family transcriptional regulator